MGVSRTAAVDDLPREQRIAAQHGGSRRRARPARAGDCGRPVRCRAAKSRGIATARNQGNRSGYPLEAGPGVERATPGATRGRASRAAPFGPPLFASERRSRYETRVYADLCPFSSVDTPPSADKLRTGKKGLKNEEFAVSWADPCRRGGGCPTGRSGVGAPRAGSDEAGRGNSRGPVAGGTRRGAAAPARVVRFGQGDPDRPGRPWGGT